MRPPVAVLAAAGVALAISASLLYLRSMQVSVVGYFLAPLVVTGLISLFRYRDALASQSPFYATQPTQMRFATWMVVLSFIIGAGHAWIIGTEVAKWFAT